MIYRDDDCLRGWMLSDGDRFEVETYRTISRVELAWIMWFESDNSWLGLGRKRGKTPGKPQEKWESRGKCGIAMEDNGGMCMILGKTIADLVC